MIKRAVTRADGVPMRCTACQAALPDGAQWCGQCFAPVTQGAPPPPPSWAPPPTGDVTPAYGAPAAPAYVAAPTYPAPTDSAPTYGPPGYAPTPAPAASRRLAWIGGTLAILLVLGIGAWTMRPGPTLRLGDLAMRTPAGWSISSTTNNNASWEGLTQSLRDKTGVQLKSAFKGSQEIAGLASMPIAAGGTAERLLPAYTPGTQMGDAHIDRSSLVAVGTRHAVQVSISSSLMSATMLFVPEESTLMIVMVGTTDSTVTDKDLAWILGHLTQQSI